MRTSVCGAVKNVEVVALNAGRSVHVQKPFEPLIEISRQP